MNFRNSRVGAAAIALLMTAGLSACGGGVEAAEVVDGPWEEVVAAAEKEGQVNLYSVAPPIQNERIVEAFNKKYPDIKITLTRGAGELPARVTSEIKAGSDGADAFIYTDPAFFSEISGDLLDVDGPSTEGWSEDFWAEEGKAIVPTKYPWTMFVWNTEIFPMGFKTWDDLLDPSVKGKVAVRNDVTTSMAATWDFMETELGSDYLTALGKQKPKYYTSAVPMGQAVASGEAGVTMISTPSIAIELKEQGAPVEFGYPKGGFSIMWGAGAPATSKRPNAARVFIDFLMSAEGQAAVNSDGFGAAGRDGVKGALDMTGWTFFDSAPYDTEKMNESKAKAEKYFGN